MWYRVLDRFGLPTLFALLLMLGVWKLSNRVIDKWEEAQSAQTAAIAKLAGRVETLADDTHTALEIMLDRERQKNPTSLPKAVDDAMDRMKKTVDP